MKDRFSKKIKERLERGRISPPDKIWQDIDRELDLDMTWLKVERELDMDQVWQGVDRTLQADYWGKWFEGITNGTFILGVLIWAFSLMAYPQDQWLEKPDSTIKSVEINQIPLSEDMELEAGQVSPPSLAKAKNGNWEGTKVPSTERNDPSSESHPSLKSIVDDEGIEEKSSEDRHLANEGGFMETRNQRKGHADVPLLAFNLKRYPVEIEMSNFNSRKDEMASNLHLEFGPIDDNPQNKEANISNWFYGAGISLSTSWINDPRHRRAKEENSLIQVRGKASFSGQIHGGYKLHNGWSVYGGLDFLGTSQQRFGEYSGGDYVKGGTLINYWGTYMALRKKYYSAVFSGSGLDKAVFIGPYLHKIESVEQDLLTYMKNAKSLEHQTQLYKPYEWGGIIGYEMLYPLNEKYQIGCKFSYRVGLNNIYQGNEQIPSYLRRTTTSELLVNVFIRRK